MSRIGKLIIPLAAVVAMLLVAAVAGMGTGTATLPGMTPAVEAAAPAQASTPIAQGLQPLGNKFVSAFHFDNTTKTWKFYYPVAPAQSTLTTLEVNKSYWIRVTENVKVTLNGRERNLTCAKGSCWNTVGW